MPRTARIVVPGVPHHITQRGVGRRKIFFSQYDRMAYLKLLQKYAERHDASVVAYYLMSNHVHLMMVPNQTDSLGKALSVTHRAYSQMINARKHWTGHLWQERFFSCPLDVEHTLSALRYIEMNPVEAGIVENAWDYRWSSAAAHCGIRSDPFLDDVEQIVTLIRTIENYKHWLNAASADAEERVRVEKIKAATRRDRPCGEKSYWESLGISLPARKPRGRPRKIGTDGTVTN